METVEVNICFSFNGNVKIKVPKYIYDEGRDAVIDYVHEEQYLYFDDMKDNMELTDVEPVIYEEGVEE